MAQGHVKAKYVRYEGHRQHEARVHINAPGSKSHAELKEQVEHIGRENEQIYYLLTWIIKKKWFSSRVEIHVKHMKFLLDVPFRTLLTFTEFHLILL